MRATLSPSTPIIAVRLSILLREFILLGVKKLCDEEQLRLNFHFFKVIRPTTNGGESFAAPS
jgi:hypothetical protein